MRREAGGGPAGKGLALLGWVLLRSDDGVVVVAAAAAVAAAAEMKEEAERGERKEGRKEGIV